MSYAWFLLFVACVAGQTYNGPLVLPSGFTNPLLIPLTAQGKNNWVSAGAGDAITNYPAADNTLLVASVSSGSNPAGYTTAAFFINLSTRETGGVDVPASAGLARQFALGDANGCANLLAGGATPTVTAVGTTWAVPVDPTFITVALELETTARHLCWRVGGGAGAYTSTGFLWKVVYDCAADNAPATDNARKCNTWATTWQNNAAYAGVRATTSALDVAQLTARTTCCRGSAANINSANAQFTVGQCVNPNIASCCGSAKVMTGTEKCCSTASEGVSHLVTSTANFDSTVCKCSSSGTAPKCPTGESCCLKRKYTELDPTAYNTDSGECFNPATHRCCDVGKRYDPETHQCCAVNGLRTNTDVCPCSANSHCAGGERDANGAAKPIAGRICCKQTAPVPSTAEDCDAYNNYPSGSPATGTDGTAGCPGRCIDPTYEICCNGARCVAESQRCCNATCCNKFTQTCVEGRQLAYRTTETFPGLAGAGVNNAEGQLYRNRHVPNELLVNYDICTEIEQLDTVKSFWIFVLPTVLLLATFAALALVLVFANNTSALRYDFIERTLIAVAVLAILFSLPLFFAPVYKYGVVVVTVALFTIITAAARVKWLNVTAVVLLAITLVYLFDPFHANAYLNLASGRYGGVVSSGNAGLIDPNTAGVLHATVALWRELNVDAGGRGVPAFGAAGAGMQQQNELRAGWGQGATRCTEFYNYFVLDVGQLLNQNLPGLRDVERWDNPEVRTFGYCSRGWITALLLFESALVIEVLVLFILAIVALIIRFTEDKSYDPIELAVQPAQYVSAPLEYTELAQAPQFVQ